MMVARVTGPRGRVLPRLVIVKDRAFVARVLALRECVVSARGIVMT